MTDLQRNALARDVAMRLSLAPFEDTRIVDRLVLRLEQLRSLSWSRRLPTSEFDAERLFHLASLAKDRVVTRCNGSWWLGDAVETSAEGPPLHQMCGECARRWARGKDLELYGLLELAHDLATEDMAREQLREEALAEMTGGAP